MNRGTIMMVAIALGTAAGAWSMRPHDLPPAQFEDTGELLFADFTDPAVATALSVVSWDEDQAKAQRFAVEQKAGLWVIPSHNDYPADGTERMGKAAASFIDVKKDVYYGDKPEDHGRFGVLDPEGRAYVDLSLSASTAAALAGAEFQHALIAIRPDGSLVSSNAAPLTID